MNIFFKLSLIIVLLGSNNAVYSQGAWDIEYSPIQSVNDSLIGKEIRLDFRTNLADTIKGNVSVLSIRNLLSKKGDIVWLNIAEKSIQFIEDWKIHVDYGTIKDQTLISLDKKIIINEMFLKRINDTSIIIEANVMTNRKSPQSNHNEVIKIDKSLIKGILF